VAGKKQHELWAETLRDIGILLFVFGPLDTLLRSQHGTRQDWLIAAGIAALGLMFIVVGVILGSES
jgi:hypothetical protein